jgi:NADH:ubiquinone reductase (H+-translocating)
MQGSVMQRDAGAPQGDAPPDGPLRSEVLVIGAGFAGLEVARGLGQAGIDTMVIDRTNHHLFQPLLYQVATAGLPAPAVSAPIRHILRREMRRGRLTVLQAEAVDIDAAARRVHLDDGGTLPFDHLIVAAGAANHWFGHDDWAAHAPGLKTLADAFAIRARVIGAFERAERCTDDAARADWLHFVVIGGGPTGVELAGTLVEIARHTLADEFRRIDPTATRITLVEAGPRLLSGFVPETSAYAAARLGRLGVDVRCGSPVKDVGPVSVRIGDQDMPVGLVIWAAGVAASPLAGLLGATDSLGRIAVEETLAVRGQEGVFALGDVAALDGPDGKPLPGLAQVARQQGIHLGRSLARHIQAVAPLQPFHYAPRGNTAIVGRHAAVFEHGRFRMTGWPAWMAWAVIHVYLLIGFQHRVIVSAQWLWRYLTYDRGARLITGEVTETPQAEPTDRPSPDDLPA